MEEIKIKAVSGMGRALKSVAGSIVYKGVSFATAHMMQDQLNTAWNFFDNYIEPGLIGDMEKKEVKDSGIDIFDLIMVEGKSLKEHCRDIYDNGSPMYGPGIKWDDLTDRQRVQFMKVETVRTMSDPAYKVAFRSAVVDDKGAVSMGDDTLEVGFFDIEASKARRIQEIDDRARKRKSAMTFNESVKGSYYGEYALPFVLEKATYCVGDFAQLLDKKYNIPITIDEKVKDPKTGQEKTVKKSNPESWRKKVRDIVDLGGYYSLEDKSLARFKVTRYTRPAIGRKLEEPHPELDFDAEVSNFYHAMLDEYDKFSIEHEADEDFLACKPMLDLLFLPLRYEQGDFARAMSDSTYLELLHTQFCVIPRFSKKNFSEIRQYMDGPTDPKTGKETKPLKLMNAYYKGINDLFGLEYEKFRLVDGKASAEEKQEFAGRLKSGMQSMVDAYEKLYAFMEEHPGEYKKGEYLDNNLDHLTGVSMEENWAPIEGIGHLRGQIKAIENGWDIDELVPLGTIGALKASLENHLRKGDYFIEDREKLFRKAEEQYNKEIVKPLADLKKAKDAYDPLKKQIDEEKKAIKAQETALKKKPDAAAEKELNLRRKTLAGMEERLKELAKPLADAQKEVNRIQKNYDEAKANLEEQKQLVAQSKALTEELKQLDETVWNRKVKTAADKKEVLDIITDFSHRMNDKYPVTNVHEILSNEVLVLKVELRKKLNTELFDEYYPQEWKKKGIPEDIGYASVRMANLIDIYGPNPKHHVNWGGHNNVINKDHFEKTFKPYDTADMPFSEMELAYLGMGYTSLNTPDNMEMLDKLPILKDTPGEEKLHQNAFWTSDLFRDNNGGRENVTSVSHIIENGRQGARRAAESYVKGDKKPVAEIIHAALLLDNDEYRVVAGLATVTFTCSYGRLTSFLALLDRDPELKAEFDAINAKMPPEKRLDTEELRSRLGILRLAVNEISSDTDEEIHPSMSDEHRDEHRQEKLRRGILNAVIHNESAQDSAHPVYIRHRAVFDTETQPLLKSGQAGLYNAGLTKYTRENSRKKLAVAYFQTPEGRKELDDFSKKIVEQYGKGKGKFQDLTTEFPVAQMEVNKFTADIRRKSIIDHIGKSEKLSDNEIRELIMDYVISSTISDKTAAEIGGAPADPMLKAMVGEDRRNTAFTKAYADKLLLFIDNMDLKDMRPHDLMEILGNSSFKEITNEIYSTAKLENMQRKKIVGEYMDEAVEALEDGNRGTWFGKKDYDEILKSLDKLNEMYKSRKEAYAENGSAAVTAEIAKKEEELIKAMEAYKKRKEKEFADNKTKGAKDNANSRRRYKAMDSAIKSLRQRMQFDRQYDRMLSDAAKYNDYVKKSSDKIVKNGYTIEVPAEPEARRLCASGALKGLGKLTQIAKDGYDQTGEMRRVVKIALAAIVLNKVAESSEKVGDNIPKSSDQYEKEIKKMADDPAFDAIIDRELDTGAIRAMLADKDAPQKLMERFYENVNKEAAKNAEKEVKKDGMEKENPGQGRKRSKSVSLPGENKKAPEQGRMTTH